MKFELKRRALNQESYEALMEIGKPVQRKDIHAILRLAEDRNISHRMINDDLLGRDSEHAQGRRLIELLEEWGLIEKDYGIYYKLTEAGRSAIESDEGMVPMPEKGYYQLYTADDPLLNESILDYEAIDKKTIENEHAEIREDRKKGREKKESKPLNIISKPPRLSRYSDGIKVPIVCQGSTPIHIYNIDDKLSLSNKKANATIGIRLEYSKKPMVFIRREKEKSVQENLVHDTALNEDFMVFLKKLVGSAEITVIDGEPTLLVPFHGLKKEEMQQFKKQLTIPRPNHPEYGTFDDTVITIRIFPAEIKDAVSWANELLKSSISDFITREAFEGKKDQMCSRFKHGCDPSEIEQIRSRMMTFESAVEESSKTKSQGSMLYWYLVAPQDLTVG